MNRLSFALKTEMKTVGTFDFFGGLRLIKYINQGESLPGPTFEDIIGPPMANNWKALFEIILSGTR